MELHDLSSAWRYSRPRLDLVDNLHLLRGHLGSRSGSEDHGVARFESSAHRTFPSSLTLKPTEVMRSESLEFLKALTSAASPSGYEGPAGAIYRDYTHAFADRVNT